MEKKTPPKFLRRSTRGRQILVREQTPEDKALAIANEETRARNWKRPAKLFKPQAAICLDFDIEESSSEEDEIQFIPPKKKGKSAPTGVQSKGTKRRHPGKKSEQEGPRKKSLKTMPPKMDSASENSSKTWRGIKLTL